MQLLAAKGIYEEPGAKFTIYNGTAGGTQIDFGGR